MGDMPQAPMAAARSNDELTSERLEQSAVSSTDSDKTVTSPHLILAENVQPQLGRGSAMFSTDLGRRGPRKSQGPPYSPVIVRSNVILDVVAAAGHWRNKYPYQYLCIFPRAGWKISDLWDEEDIRFETKSFCTQVLRFIERDNGVRAQKYAQDWSKMHPERLPIVGGDMTELYDKRNPLSIVSRIFVNEESQEYPPIFLWHVTHNMRTAMLAVRGIELPIQAVVDDLEHPSVEYKDSLVDNSPRAPVTAGVAATLPSVLAAATSASLHVIGPAAPIIDPKPISSWHTDRTFSPIQDHIIDPTAGGNYLWVTAHRSQIAPGQHAGGTNAVHSALRVPRNRTRRSASGPYNQIMPYIENMPRVPSGLGPRQHVSPIPMIQSLRYNQTYTAMNLPIGNIHPGIVSGTYEQIPMPSGMIVGQPQSHTIMQPSIMPPHTTQAPSMASGYPRQPSGSQGGQYAMPMGDMTNMPYALSMHPQHVGSPHPGDSHFSQQYMNGHALYDPYKGSNPTFRTINHTSGNNKKTSQNGLHISNGRPRKTSLQGSRPYQGQYANDRPVVLHMGSRRFPGPKCHFEIDLATTQDRNYGCDVDWIGPQNVTVNELYVKDLPEDIQTVELQDMFLDRLGVKPTSTVIRGSQQAQGRKHAFVGFSNTSIAKQAIVIRNPTIRGLPISVTVPKRFFQKTVEAPKRDLAEAVPSSYSRYTSSSNSGDYRNRMPSVSDEGGVTVTPTSINGSLPYSPQDARSDLHKKCKQPQGSTTRGSPDARKGKPNTRQGSLVQESHTTKAVLDRAQQLTKANDHTPTPDAAPGAFSMNRSPVQQPQACSSMPPNREEKSSITLTEGRQTVSATPLVQVSGAVGSIPSSTSNQQQCPTAMQLDLRVESNIKPCTEERTEQGLTGQGAVQGSTEQGPAEKSMAPMVPPDPKDVAPKGELNLHANSHSAAESQPAIEAKAEPGTGNDYTNQGTEFIRSKVVATADCGPSTPANSDARAATVDATPPLGDKVISASARSQPSIPEKTTATMQPPDLQEAGASKALQNNTLPVATRPAVLEAVKKSGAQHTESLHPFSKAAKALAKKEKEQKKKAQKKEKEQAERIKAAKVAANKATAKTTSVENDGNTNRNSGNVSIGGKIKLLVENNADGEDTGPSTGNGHCATVGEVSTVTTSVKKSTSAVMSPRKIDHKCNKPGKWESKKIGTTTTNDTATAEKKDEDHGKQTGGTINIPNELSLVTNMEVKVDLPNDGLNPDAQCSKQVQTHEASRVAKESGSTVHSAEELTPAAAGTKKSKTKKKKKASKTWPDLEFRPKSPNPSWMGPIDMATDIQHYDEIMHRACSGDDDSDFSWSDLPQVEDEISDDDEDNHDGGDGVEDDGQDLEAINKRIAELQGQQATTTLNTSHGAITISSQFGAGLTSIATPENVACQDITALGTQFAATNEETTIPNVSIAAGEEQIVQSTGTQVTSGATAPTSQTAKKKKSNNRKNKKKKKAADNAEVSGISQSCDAAEGAQLIKSALNMTVEDLIDSDDPFYDQLKEIDDTKRGNQGVPSLRGDHTDAAKTCDEPQLMRTMEAYFKETQGSSQSNGRGQGSKKDLYD